MENKLDISWDHAWPSVSGQDSRGRKLSRQGPNVLKTHGMLMKYAGDIREPRAHLGASVNRIWGGCPQIRSTKAVDGQGQWNSTAGCLEFGPCWRFGLARGCAAVSHSCAERAIGKPFVKAKPQTNSTLGPWGRYVCFSLLRFKDSRKMNLISRGGACAGLRRHARVLHANSMLRDFASGTV